MFEIELHNHFLPSIASYEATATYQDSVLCFRYRHRDLGELSFADYMMSRSYDEEDWYCFKGENLKALMAALEVDEDTLAEAITEHFSGRDSKGKLIGFCEKHQVALKRGPWD